MPKNIQEELLQYPETVENDSSYENDETVKNKYKKDSLKYIEANDEFKKDQVLKDYQPRRLFAAR